MTHTQRARVGKGERGEGSGSAMYFSVSANDMSRAVLRPALLLLLPTLQG
jgi:hypothetical protein